MTNPTVDGVEVASQSDLSSAIARIAALEARPEGKNGTDGKDGPTADAIVQAFVDIVAQVVKGGTVTVTGGTGAATTGAAPSNPAPGSGSGVGSATDTNAYPLTLSAPDADGTQTAGEGPNQIDLYLASDPGSVTNNVVVLVNGKAVIAPNFTVASTIGMSKAGSNHLVLKGPWGSSPSVQIKGVAPNGINGMWMNGATIDFVDLVANGAYDSRGAISVNANTLFVSNGADITLTLPVAVAQTTAAPVATLTTINGQTLDALLAAVAPGSTTTLPAETIIGTGAILQQATVSGAGIDKTIIDATNVPIKYSKGVIVPQGNGDIITDMTVQNGYINASLGLNGAGVRNSDSTIGFTLQRVKLKNNQNGVLTDSASVGPFLIDSCEMDANGEVTQPGDTHQFYIGGLPTAIVTFTNNKTINGCRDGHEFKSRCGTNNLSGNVLVTGGNGSCVDVPNGGLLNITGDDYTLPASAADRNFLTYAMENDNNAATGHAVVIKNTVFRDMTGQGGFIQTKQDPLATLELDGCTYTGAVAPQLVGWASVTGTLTKAG